MTGPGRPVRQPANTRASVLLTCFLQLAAFPCMPATRTFISARGGADRERRTPRARPMRTIPSSTFQGCFQLLRHDPVGGSSGRSVVHTPRHWETGRPRAAQFALWAVYIPGGGTTWCRRKERRMVTADLLSRARAGDGEAFRELAESHRRELQVHCYRMLGSFADAEDAVQETLLAAWQGIGGFTEERASLRTWLYKIATSRCLNARRAASRRPARKWDMSPFQPRVGVGRSRRAGGPADRRHLHRYASGAIRIRGPRRRGPLLGPPVRRGPQVRPRADPSQRPARVRGIPARPGRNPPRDRLLRAHPGRRPDLRHDPLRGQRAAVVRATAIAPGPVTSLGAAIVSSSGPGWGMRHRIPEPQQDPRPIRRGGRHAGSRRSGGHRR